MNRWAKVLFIVAVVLAMALPGFAQEDGRYMVKFKELRGAADMVRSHGGRPVLELGPQRVVAAYLPEAALRGLQNNPNVEYIEVDAPRYPMAETTPYGITMVQADLLTNSTPGSCTVCIIDSGYYLAHEDLNANSVSGVNNSGTGDWFVDTCGHGTHVAGTVAAVKNGVGVVGVNSKAGDINIHVQKVFDGATCAWTYSSSLIQALNNCRNQVSSSQKLVVSMSLGGSTSSTTENNAFQSAYDAGVLSIAAAGNDGSTRMSYPASYSSVVSVAAVDSTGLVADFSQKNTAVEVAAPGVAVLSTTPFKASTLTAGGNTWIGANIDGSARVDRSGALVDGGLCGAAGAWSGKVVLCLRGTYSFAEKVAAVANGGGVAAVIYNNVSGGFAGTLNGTSTIPAISISMEDGQAAAAFFGQPSSVVNSEGIGNGYEAWDGTSMATPHVSGVAALVWSNFTTKTNAQIREALQMTAEDKGVVGRDTSYGFGIVKAKAAYDYLAGATPPPPPPPPAGITLTVAKVKVVKSYYADLAWTGATGVDIYRDGVKIATDDASPYRDGPVPKGVHAYKVCAGTTCSNTVSLRF